MSDLINLISEKSDHEWGSEEFLEKNEFYTLSKICIKAGKCLEQNYDNSIGAIYVLKGEIKVKLDESDGQEYGKDEVWTISDKQRLEAQAKTDFEGLRLTVPDFQLAKELTGVIEDEYGTIMPEDNYTVDKPWGSERWFVKNDVFVIKGIHMDKANHMSSLQYHRRKMETNILIKGSAVIHYGREGDNLKKVTVGVGEGWTTLPMVIHRVESLDPYYAIEVSTPELDDIVRIQDKYGRGSGKIESEHSAGRK